MAKLSRTIKYTAILFTRNSKSTGILLIACTLLSLLLTNLSSPGESYIHFWETADASLHHLGLPATLMEWINDGLMALFFLTAGMEIKHELAEGELSTLKKAVLPLFAAIGGVILPALLYTLFNRATPYAHGWGIPTATDIAFPIGIMSILGRKYVSASLKIFLTALAITDDLIAILMVAFFYGGTIKWIWLATVTATTIALCILFRKYPKPAWIHYLLGVVLWYALIRSGIHATMAGVIFGCLIPVKNMQPIARRLHFPVNFIVLPLFAAANTCIPFNVRWADIFGHSLFWGISIGLAVGKVTGITLFAYILIRLKWAVLPSHTNWGQFTGAGILAGIGFTMSIFISTLAFDHAEWQNTAKIAVLFGSGFSMITGYCWLRWWPKRKAGLPER